MNRRDFLKALGLGSLAVAAPDLITPARRMWFVPSSAPVGSRVERLSPQIDVAEMDRLLREARDRPFDPDAYRAYLEETRQTFALAADDAERAAASVWTPERVQQAQEAVDRESRLLHEIVQRETRVRRRAEQDRVWDEAGREGRSLPAGWTWNPANTVRLGMSIEDLGEG